MAEHKSGKKNRKHGRNKIDCKAYRDSRRQEKNKIKKLEKVLLRNPNDKDAIAAIARCKAIVKG